MSAEWRRWIMAMASVFLIAIAPAAYAQDDILDEIEAELRKEEEAKKAAAKAAKNEEKYALNYRKAVSKGDALIKSKKFDEAIAAYQEAKKWGPTEKYPDEKITEAKEMKAKAAEEAKQAEIDEKYKAVIVKADAFFESKKYKESIPLYQEAVKLKPDEAWAQDQITEAKKLQAQLEEEKRKAEEAAKLEAEFKAAMKSGDDKLASQDFDGAIASYEQAAKLKPGEAAPKTKIAEAKKAKEEAAKLAAQQKLDAEYQAAVGKADDLFKQKKWDESVTAYQEALKIKPGETHPKTQITEAGRLKEEEKQAAIREKYDAVIAEADGLLKSSEFDQAKAKYEEASKILPSETYPGTKMKECDDLKLQAEKAKIKSQYDELVKAADALLEQEKFDEAKAKYQEAQNVMPHESHPATMIAEADRRKEDKAKQATRAEYDAAVAQGNDLLANEKFDEAIAQYKAAEKILPSESKTTELIAEAEKLKSQKAQAETRSQYDAAIASAEALLKEEKFDEAITGFEAAGKILPNESKTAELIAEAKRLKEAKAEGEKLAQFESMLAEGEKLIADKQYDAGIKKLEEAHAFYPKENRTPELIAEAKKMIEADKQAEIQAQFDAKVKEGETQMQDGQYDVAISTFRAAEDILPTNSKTTELIAEANRLKEEEQKKKDDDQFDSYLAQGSTLMAEEKFSEAREQFKMAKELVPGRALEADKKIEEATRLEKEKTEKELAAAEAAEKEAKVTALLGEAKSLEEGQNYSGAKDKLAAALLIDPENGEVKTSMARVSGLLDEQEKQQREQEEAEKAAKLKAEQEGKADALLAQATTQASGGNHREALNLVDEALGLVPNYTPALEKKSEYQTALDAAVKAEKEKAAEEAEQQAAQEEKERKLAQLIAQGEQFESEGKLTDAKGKYQEALNLDSGSSEAQQKLQSVTDKMAAQEKEKAAAALAAQQAADKAELQEKVQAFIDQGNEALAAENWAAAKSAYQQALSIDDGNSTAQSQIALVDQKMAEQEAAEQARLKAEQEKQAAAAKAQEEEELKKQIESLMSEGDAALNSGDLTTAKGKFNQVLTLDASHALAGTRLQQIKDREAKEEQDRLAQEEAEKARLQAEKEKQEAAALAQAAEERKKQIQTLVDEADAAFNGGDLTTAKSKFNEVLTLEAGHTLATTRIQQITEREAKEEQERLAQEEAERARLQAEKEKQAAAARAQAAEERKKQIQTLVDEADAAFNSGDLTTAKSKFNEVLALDAGHTLANTRIQQISERQAKEEQERLAQEEAEKARLQAERDKQAAAARAEAEEKKKQEIQTLVGEADAAFNSGDLATAKTKFDQVLAMDAAHALAGTRIKQIAERQAKEEKDRLAKEEAARKKQADADRAKAEQEKKNQIASYLDLGDQQLADKKFSEALDSYEQALDLDPASAVVKSRIANANKLKSAHDRLTADQKEKLRQEEISNYMAQGKMQAIKKEFLAAKASYEKVLNLEPGHAGAKEALASIQKDVALLEAQQAEEEERRKAREALLAKVETILDAGDNYFAGGQYAEAIQEYQKGLELDPLNTELKESIRNCRKMEERAKQIHIAKTHHLPRPKPEGFKTEQLSESSVRKDKIKFQNELGRAYPEGVTEEIRKGHRKSLTYRIVVLEGIGTEYVQARHDWGGVYYFKNGHPITPYIWQLETRDPVKATN
ncbi:tetratricopeptide repeat protein [bacterium SCSIO 12741]|nr:tetratricopeptide repeat protein [bacterium SCSIO 12741]